MVKITSDDWASSCTEVATVAPRSARALVLAAVRLKTVRFVPRTHEVAAHRSAHDSRANPADPRLPRGELESHDSLQSEWRMNVCVRSGSCRDRSRLH